MKSFLFPLILLAFFSCRRDEKEYVKMIVGDTTNMVVTYHHTLIADSLTTGSPWSTGKINLDEFEGNDISIKSWTSKINFPAGKYCKAWIEIDNDQFSIAEVPGSGIVYETLEMQYDFYGTFARETYNYGYSCEFSEEAIPDTSYGSGLAFRAGDEVISFLKWDNFSNRVDLAENPTQYIDYDFNLAGDSLIGENTIDEGICRPLPEDEFFYLVFKKQLLTVARYGWVELKISDQNAVYISRSAITP